ncbi:anti-phage protein KwaA [Sporolactobacillus vineae]|uniref:anti-phage protein KwaA n=1 Tax=Sporolactobacillus vineae TaxID=444463 RepID=UPI0002888D54|nr:anti-phage protein KwaA [Sporolactobacillus vineae]
MNNFVKSLFFISSYMPLFVFLAIANISLAKNNKHDVWYKIIWENNWHNLGIETRIFWIIITFLMVISILAIVIFTNWKTSKSLIVIPNMSLLKDEVMSYVVTYVIPILSLNVKSSSSLIINSLLFVTIGVIYVKNDLIYLNPVLSLLGYRVYSDNENIYLSKIKPSQVKRGLKLKKKVLVWHIIGNVYILKLEK